MNPVGRATAALAPFPALRRCASLVELRSAYACVVVAMRAPQQPSARQHRSSVHTAGRRAALAAQQHASRQPQAGRLHPRVDDAHPSMVAEGAGAAAGGGGASGQPAPLPRHPSDSTRYAPASAAPMQAGESAAASDAERSASPSAEAEQSSEVDGLNGAGSLAARDPYADVLHVDVMGEGGAAVMPPTLASWLPCMRRQLSGAHPTPAARARSPNLSAGLTLPRRPRVREGTLGSHPASLRPSRRQAACLCSQAHVHHVQGQARAAWRT